MTVAVVSFPWDRLRRVERAALAARSDLFMRLLGAIDPTRIGSALSQLLGEAVEVAAPYLTERRRAELPRVPALDAVSVQFPTQGLRLVLQPEADLLRACVARLLEQDFELGWADTGIDAALRGAGTALTLEVARRAARGEAPELTTEVDVDGEWVLSGSTTVRLGGKPYRLELLIEPLATARPREPLRPATGLARLGGVRLAVPWVAATSRVERALLERLEVGDVWLPSSTGWVAAEPALSAGLLAPPRSTWGLPVRAVGGRTVLGADAAVVHEEPESSMNHEESELEQIVGELPLVVRLEVGALEMSAAEWAALRPGDVVQSGRRLEDPVILRAGGHEIARGELVEVEGEIGVRITQVGSSRTAP